jgi:hypothetical protein
MLSFAYYQSRRRPSPPRARGRVLGAVFLLLAVGLGQAAWALDITNAYSSRNRERPRRKSTQFIILHTTEGSKTSSLHKLQKNGEAHYLVDTGGKVYRIIDKSRVAFHAGRSMWSGRTNLDTVSVGVEIVGYHNKSLTSAQYRAVRELVDQLQGIYKVPDSRVLTHSAVAYGTPNRWHKKNHRGRKRCAMLLAKTSSRTKLGLSPGPSYDPDVREGRLIVADQYLAKILYGSARERVTAVARFTGSDAQTISAGRSAWDIARDKYKDHETRYIFPDGTEQRGDEVRDWKKIPQGTRVVLNGGTGRENKQELVKEIGKDGNSAWNLAGDEYASRTTIYLFADGRVRMGDQLSKNELSSLPKGTRVLVGYTYGGKVTPKRSAFDICGKKWNFPSTFYRLSDGTIQPGDTITERSIPRDAVVFFQN